MATAILVTDSEALLGAVGAELDAQIAANPRAELSASLWSARVSLSWSTVSQRPSRSPTGWRRSICA